MKSLKDNYHFDKQRTKYEDGVLSNLVCSDVDETNHVWRFLDLTPHVLYLSKIIEQVITQDMQAESQYLKQHDEAREAIKEIIEMPNDYADRIIRSIQENGAKRSNKLVKEMPRLADDELYQKLVRVVRSILVL